MSKITLLISDDSDKTVSVKSSIDEVGEETTAALLIAASTIALFNSGFLLNIGLRMAENPQKSIKDIINDANA